MSEREEWMTVTVTVRENGWDSDSNTDSTLEYSDCLVQCLDSLDCLDLGDIVAFDGVEDS